MMRKEIFFLNLMGIMQAIEKAKWRQKNSFRRRTKSGLGAGDK
jgi:hypothetical protein